MVYAAVWDSGQFDLIYTSSKVKHSPVELKEKVVSVSWQAVESKKAKCTNAEVMQMIYLHYYICLDHLLYIVG